MPLDNGAPCKVFDNHPKVTHKLWKLICIAWNRETVPSSWNKAERIFLPSGVNFVGIPTFHPVSLFNVDGKGLFDILAKRILSFFLIDNGYIG